MGLWDLKIFKNGSSRAQKHEKGVFGNSESHKKSLWELIIRKSEFRSSKSYQKNECLGAQNLEKVFF
jgi:hypothetical protein